jgi:hypothetical protein
VVNRAVLVSLASQPSALGALHHADVIRPSREVKVGWLVRLLFLCAMLGLVRGLVFTCSLIPTTSIMAYRKGCARLQTCPGYLIFRVEIGLASMGPIYMSIFMPIASYFFRFQLPLN